MARPYDVPIPGYGNFTVNNLRLWSAEPTREFNFDFFNRGDYIKAVEDKIHSENITSVLYPNDNVYAGKELRLKQQYLMISASLQDILRRFQKIHKDWDLLPEKVAIQLNDTHPAMAVAELMRLLMDEKNLGWDRAWDLTQRTIAYTNHTVLPEALEKWSVSLLERLLPRHLQIIYEINRRFLKAVGERFPNDPDLLHRVSLVEEGANKQVRMAYLAVVGSHSINGVARLHSRLITETIFKDFYKLYPERFQNKTNGITQRRWLAVANPSLSRTITKRIGRTWVRDLNDLRHMEDYLEDSAFRTDWARSKRDNKELLAKIIKQSIGTLVSPDSMFDIQVKRIHEYKRQHLNLLHILYLYLQMRADPKAGWVPRTVIFSGKAAPGYHVAKLIIKLVHEAAAVINSDPKVKDLLKVVFLADYKVSLAERIMPACDLSEQISTAGTEASGTGNMKFALNGALTIGTYDGANIEISEEVGEDNIFIFGLRENEVISLRESGYNPWDYYNKVPMIKEVMDFVQKELIAKENRDLMQPLLHTLLDGGDHYLVFADFESYVKKQREVAELYADHKEWLKKSILNSARMGKFSSDRTIDEYAREIWNAKPVEINPKEIGSLYSE
jgi:starch phosphorylase